MEAGKWYLQLAAILYYMPEVFDVMHTFTVNKIARCFCPFLSLSV